MKKWGRNCLFSRSAYLQHHLLYAQTTKPILGDSKFSIAPLRNSLTDEKGNYREKTLPSLAFFFIRFLFLLSSLLLCFHRIMPNPKTYRWSFVSLFLFQFAEQWAPFITIISSGRYLHLGMFLGQKCPFWAPKNAHWSRKNACHK
jgi:hypothetical protein